MRYKTIICKLASSAIAVSLLFSLFACGKSADQEAVSSENNSSYSVDEFSEDMVETSEDSSDYASEEIPEDRAENADSMRKYWRNNKNEMIANEDNNLFTTKELLNKDDITGLSEDWMHSYFSKTSAQNVLKQIKAERFNSGKVVIESSVDPIRLDVSKRPTSPIDITVTSDNMNLSAITFVAYDYIPEKDKLSDPNSPSAYLVLEWEERKTKRCHVAIAEVYVGISEYNNPEDMFSLWSGVKEPFDKDLFSIETRNKNIIDTCPADIFCFFKKSNAEACFNYFLNNSKYQKYEESMISPVWFTAADRVTKDLKSDLKLMDGTNLGKLCLKNSFYLPDKSKLKSESSPTAWLVIVWKDFTDQKNHVALVDVFASVAEAS